MAYMIDSVWNVADRIAEEALTPSPKDKTLRVTCSIISFLRSFAQSLQAFFLWARSVLRAPIVTWYIMDIHIYIYMYISIYVYIHMYGFHIRGPYEARGP